MTRLMALSISTGILCGIWIEVSVPLQLISWAGFAGCTTYFASGKHNFEGFLVTARQNLFGVLSGMTIIYLTLYLPFAWAAGVYGGIVTFIMCIAGKIKYFAFIPGTFVGCYSTFAANGDYKALIPSLIAGAALGVMCDVGGKMIFGKFGKEEEQANS